MKGYKTIITALLSVVGGVATMLGVTLDPELIAEIQVNLETFIGVGMILYGAIMAVLRAFTSSPMFNGKRGPGGGTLSSVLVPFVLVGLVLSQVVGCAGVTPRIQTPADQVALAYATIDSLTSTTKQYYLQKRITKTQKDQIAEDLRRSKDYADMAKAFIVENKPGDAVQMIQVLNQALLTIEADIEGGGR